MQKKHSFVLQLSKEVQRLISMPKTRKKFQKITQLSFYYPSMGVFQYEASKNRFSDR